MILRQSSQENNRLSGFSNWPKTKFVYIQVVRSSGGWRLFSIGIQCDITKQQCLQKDEGVGVNHSKTILKNYEK